VINHLYLELNKLIGKINLITHLIQRKVQQYQIFLPKAKMIIKEEVIEIIDKVSLNNSHHKICHQLLKINNNIINLEVIMLALY
jgi:hypothetical protein